MSEQYSFNPENQPAHVESKPEKATVPEKLQDQAEQPKPTETKLDDLRQHIENQSVSGKEITVGEKETGHSVNNLAVTRDLKLREYWRTIHRIRSRLTPSQRLGSRIIHQPAIDKVSSVTSQTVARSVGLLFGAIFALVGSLIFISFAKRNGIHYNYAIFFLLFIAGYLVGLVVELVGKLIRPRH